MTKFQYLDKRVQRTKLHLFHALYELLKHKNYTNISIKDIIEEAGYSRGTFYTHYGNKDDLLNDFMDHLFNEMIEAYRSTYIGKETIDILGLVDEPFNLLEHFKGHGDYYQTLLSNNVQIDFRSILTNKIIQIYLEDFAIQDTRSENKVDENLINRYCAYGLAGLISEWIIDDFPIPSDIFSVELVKVFQYSLGTIKIKKNIHF